MAKMTVHADLVFDPNDVAGGEVECWISQSPRAADASCNPCAGDLVTLIDEDGETLRGRVSSRDGNRVWVQVRIPGRLPLAATIRARLANPAPSVPLDDLIDDLGFSASQFE
jgi:hypothetical protein